MNITPTIEARYWAKVQVGDTDNCWPWTGKTHRDGYGEIQIRIVGGAKKTLRATHIALWLEGQFVPPGMQANHTCDNPPCVNPHHLYVGTQRQNIEDMVRRGRTQRRSGENAGHYRLTDLEVRTIRERYAVGEGPSVLAAEYLTTSPYIGVLVRGDCRRTAGGPIQPKRQQGKRLAGKDEKRIESLLAKGVEG